MSEIVTYCKTNEEVYNSVSCLLFGDMKKVLYIKHLLIEDVYNIISKLYCQIQLPKFKLLKINYELFLPRYGIDYSISVISNDNNIIIHIKEFGDDPEPAFYKILCDTNEIKLFEVITWNYDGYIIKEEFEASFSEYDGN